MSKKTKKTVVYDSKNPAFRPKKFLHSIMNKTFDFRVNETCSLCNAKITDFRDSHNPYPLTKNMNDRCCSKCNDSVVFNARIQEMLKSESENV